MPPLHRMGTSCAPGERRDPNGKGGGRCPCPDLHLDPRRGTGTGRRRGREVKGHRAGRHRGWEGDRPREGIEDWHEARARHTSAASLWVARPCHQTPYPSRASSLCEGCTPVPPTRGRRLWGHGLGDRVQGGRGDRPLLATRRCGQALVSLQTT